MVWFINNWIYRTMEKLKTVEGAVRKNHSVAESMRRHVATQDQKFNDLGPISPRNILLVLTRHVLNKTRVSEYRHRASDYVSRWVPRYLAPLGLHAY